MEGEIAEEKGEEQGEEEGEEEEGEEWKEAGIGLVKKWKMKLLRVFYHLGILTVHYVTRDKINIYFREWVYCPSEKIFLEGAFTAQAKREQ